MAYRAEIEIAVKGANQLSSFQGKLNASALAVDNLNKFLKAFSNESEGISRSVSNLNKQLQTAARNFNEVALGTDEAKTAAINYLNATRNLNEGLRERAALLAEVAENERKAKLASAGIRETTQFSGPIGPGPASQTALSSPLPPSSRLRGFTQYEGPIGPGPISQTALFSRLPPRSELMAGQSSPVGDLVQRNLKIKQDELALENALLKLKERKADAVFEELKNSEALVRSANEAKLIAAEARGERPSSQLSILSPEQQLRAESIERAEQIAKNAKLKSDANQKVFQAEREFAQEIFKIEQSLDKKVRDQEIDNILKKFKLEEDSQNRLFENALSLDKKEGDIFDRELKRREKAREDSFKRQRSIAESVAKSSPIGGAEDIPGSPAFLRARARRRRDAASNALIGGAFPLLFGQGGGAAVGGALGGGAGGLIGGQFGFGLSLVGTQLGTIVDTFVQNTQKLAESLKSPVETLGALEEAGFLVDDSVKQAVQQLLKANKVYEAQAIALKEVTDTLGPDAVKLLTAYDAENKKLKSEYERLTASITSGVLPSLVGAIALINDFSSALNSVKIPEGLTRFLFQLGISGAAGVIPGLGTAKAAAEFVSARGRRAGEEAGPPGLSPELVEQAEKAAAEEVKRQSTLERSEEILRAQIEAQRAGVDLLDENLVAAKENVIQQRYYRDLVEEQNKGLDTQLPKLNRALALAQLRAQVTAAEKANQARLDREAEQAARKRALEEKRAEQERVRNKVQGLNLDLQLIKVNQDQVTLQTGEIAGITRKLLDLAKTKKILTDIATLNSKNPENLNKELDLIDQKLDYEQRILEAKRNQAKVDLEAFVDAALTANKRAVEDAERQTQAVRTQLQNPFDIQAQQSNALLTEQLEEQISLTRRLQDEERKLNDQKAKASSIEDKELAGVLLDNFKKTAEALTNELHLRQELERQQLRQNQLTEKYGFLANELSTAMSSAVQAVVTGTGTVEEAFSTMFANISKAFIDMATQMLAQKLFMTVLNALNPVSTGVNPSGAFNIGLAAGRASGGSVSPGSTYLVGERGPELLTMGPSGGYVTSNSASQAAMDRYSSGNARGGSISVNYNVTDINGMRFVTEDQFRAGVAQAAKQGADGGFNRTMSSLKNNRSTRSRIGV